MAEAAETVMTTPKPAGAVDAPIAFLFHVGCHERRATDQHR
jgi:hypothetical protein